MEYGHIPIYKFVYTNVEHWIQAIDWLIVNTMSEIRFKYIFYSFPSNSLISRVERHKVLTNIFNISSKSHLKGKLIFLLFFLTFSYLNAVIFVDVYVP